jgi:DNA-binding transcriptional regulator YiaG
LKPIDAIRILVGCGLTMLKAKRTIEALQDKGEIEVRLPAIPNMTKTRAHLSQAGVRAIPYVTDAIDVKAVREQLALTQEQFALRFNLPLNTVQHWEQGRELDQASNNYVRLIQHMPERVSFYQLEQEASVKQDPAALEKQAKRGEWTRNLWKATEGTTREYAKLSVDKTATFEDIRRAFFAYKNVLLDQSRPEGMSEANIERWREVHEAEWWAEELKLRLVRGLPSRREEEAKPKRRA